jgi:hypothetical protein
MQAASDGQALAQRQAAAMKLLLADHLREEGTLLRGLLLQQEQLEELRGQVAAEQAATAAAQKELAKKVRVVMWEPGWRAVKQPPMHSKLLLQVKPAICVQPQAPSPTKPSVLRSNRYTASC